MNQGFRLQIHWSPAPGIAGLELAEFLRLCSIAANAELDSIHVPIRSHLHEALEWAVAGSRETPQLKFRIGGDIEEVLSSLKDADLQNGVNALPGRIVVHMNSAANQQPRSEALIAAGELISNCRTLFSHGAAPRFDLEGQSAEAAFVAIKHADCLWRLPDRTNQVFADALPVLHFGKEVGLSAFVIARETREEAMELAPGLLPGACEDRLRDAGCWKSPCLWCADRDEGIAAIIGSYADVAAAINAFKQAGISHFMVRELRWGDEIMRFSTMVLPLARAIESGQAAA